MALLGYFTALRWRHLCKLYELQTRLPLPLVMPTIISGLHSELSLSFSHLSRCFLTAASIWALSLDVCSCSWFASALPLSLFVPSPFASRIKYTLCVCTLSFGHSGSMANCWFCRFPLYPPSLSFHLSVCLSVAAFSMRLRHTFLASFFYSFLFCFCPRLVYIFTLEFAPCDDAAVIFQAVFQPTSNAHTHTHTPTDGDRLTH